MARTCTVCRHPERERIDADLVSGRGTFRRLGGTYGLSPSALRRHHRDHVAEVLRKATSLDAIARADSLYGQLQELRAHTLSIYVRAKEAGDLKAELAAIRELRSIAELEDRARDRRGDVVQLHVLSALPDGTINPTAADATWNAVAEASRGTGTTAADPRRVIVPAEALAGAEATVRAVLAEQGAPVATALTLADARLADAILRARQRADAIVAARQRAERLRQREATEAIDQRIVTALIANVVTVVCEYVDPRDVGAALDKLRAMLARYVPGTATEASLPREEFPEALQGIQDPEAALPSPEASCGLGPRGTGERPISRLLTGGEPGAEADETAPHRPPLDETPASGAGRYTSRVEPVSDPMPEHADPGAADSTLRCGTCANMTRDGWCRLRQFTVTPALPACEFYEPVPASRFPGT